MLASRFFHLISFCLAALLAAFVVGCKNKESAGLSAPQVHAISNEMLRASSDIVGQAGSIDSRLQFDGVRSDRTDHLYFTLSANAPEAARRESLARLIRTLDRIGTSHHLTRELSTGTGAIVRFNYRSAGVLTNSIHIITPLPVRTPAASGQQPNANGTPRLAIILDDLGADRAAADAIFALPYPLTISVLPNHVHSADIAEEAHRRGYQVMLHLPMQSVGNEKHEELELQPGMSAGEIPRAVTQMLESVPNAAGVNNHQGSQATADPQLMAELMPVLREWKLFYIDSRTTTATVAYDAAQREGVRCAFRNVPFLDDVQEAGAIRRQLHLAIRGAREKGEAIAIGHPHPATLQALSEILPQAEAQGVRLVYASDLVH